jgi:hypothetical protein
LDRRKRGFEKNRALLHLTLLGGFEARAGDASPVVFARKKAQALLAYLAVDPGEAGTVSVLTSAVQTAHVMSGNQLGKVCPRPHGRRPRTLGHEQRLVGQGLRRTRSLGVVRRRSQPTRVAIGRLANARW